MPTIYVLSKNKKNITIFHLKIIIFTAVKNCSILHGHVFVMLTTGSRSRGYKTFFMLNSTEPEFYPAHKCQNANNIISRINDWLGDFNLKFPSI